MAGAEQFGVGSGAAHFLSGHAFVACRIWNVSPLRIFAMRGSALLFSTGYLANLAILTALADRETLICADKLNHACLNDGARLSRAEFRRYAHGDVEASCGKYWKAPLRSARSSPPTRCSAWMATSHLSQSCLSWPRTHDALLVVDDAHGLRRTWAQKVAARWPCSALQSPRIVLMATLGKAVGTSGAFIAARRDIVDWIMQTASSYLFTTAAPPLIAHATLTALAQVRDGDALRRRLQDNITHFRKGAAEIATKHDWSLFESATAIQPIIIGDNAAALAVSEALLQAGIWAPVIRPPTVPEGTTRLRISLSAAHTFDDIDCLLGALAKVSA